MKHPVYEKRAIVQNTPLTQARSTMTAVDNSEHNRIELFSIKPSSNAISQSSGVMRRQHAPAAYIVSSTLTIIKCRAPNRTQITPAVQLGCHQTSFLDN